MPESEFGVCPITKEGCGCGKACRITVLLNYLETLPPGIDAVTLYTNVIPGMLEGLTDRQIKKFYELANIPRPPKCENPLEDYKDIFERLNLDWTD
jgi:hypothetical protein